MARTRVQGPKSGALLNQHRVGIDRQSMVSLLGVKGLYHYSHRPPITVKPMIQQSFTLITANFLSWYDGRSSAYACIEPARDTYYVMHVCDR